MHNLKAGPECCIELQRGVDVGVFERERVHMHGLSVFV